MFFKDGALNPFSQDLILLDETLIIFDNSEIE